MEWEGGRQSENVEDRRGGSRGGRFAIGGIGTLILAIIIFFLGGDPTQVLNIGQHQSEPVDTRPVSAKDDKALDYVQTILASTEDVWNIELPKIGKKYSEPVMVLFSGETMSDCGGAHAATGPFYCPADKKVYLDLSFFNELQNRFGVEGNFAPAYVIAHEIGHHIQDQLGLTTKVHTAQQRMNKVDGNKLSVMLELQADFLAGFWARRAGNQYIKLTENDIRSALTAAQAIGDDKLQMQSQGYVVPDAFTHGTSEQRMEWFMRGFKASNLDEGNTFQLMK